MDERTRQILTSFASGRIPEDIPEDCEYAGELKTLSEYLSVCYRFAIDISNGDLSKNYVGLKGMLAGSLKTLHANLRHLTWQTKQISQGDLTQRIDFLGDFSSSFNCMVESLDEACTALLHVSTHDSLTGLYNRAYFDAELQRVASGRCFPAGIIVVDLNGLKEVNDSRGHEFGDRLLQQAAAVLKGAFRGDDVVARIGGDEFAVIMPAASEEIVQATVARVHQQLTENNAGGREHGASPLSMALGCAVAKTRHELKRALSLADERMYVDKRRQKGGAKAAGQKSPALFKAESLQSIPRPPRLSGPRS
jgi:two-component system, cell cycle response regulator